MNFDVVTRPNALFERCCCWWSKGVFVKIELAGPSPSEAILNISVDSSAFVGLSIIIVLAMFSSNIFAALPWWCWLCGMNFSSPDVVVVVVAAVSSCTAAVISLFAYSRKKERYSWDEKWKIMFRGRCSKSPFGRRWRATAESDKTRWSEMKEMEIRKMKENIHILSPTNQQYN